MTQLGRRAAVLRILQQDNLSAWARAYWGTVFDTIAMNEERYNARAENYFKNMKKEVDIY
tara:strand:+ start:511 stop:690 length:180 start_codon:yes stop_codon:yes gene_type:complete